MWSPNAATWRVGLSDQHVTLAKTSLLRPRHVQACSTLACPSDEAGVPWLAAVTALERWLAEQRGTQPVLHVVLSGAFTRWKLMPWRAELTHPDEISAYAALGFKETFGKVADNWQVLPSIQWPGHAAPACAVDTALIQALQACCKASGARLASVRPYYAAAFDHWRAVLGRKPSWFALVEPGCVSLGLVQGGNWLGLQNQRTHSHWREVLTAMVAQMEISAALVDPHAPIYLAGLAEAPAKDPNFNFTWLRPKSLALRDLAVCRMALGV